MMRSVYEKRSWFCSAGPSFCKEHSTFCNCIIRSLRAAFNPVPVLDGLSDWGNPWLWHFWVLRIIGVGRNYHCWYCAENIVCFISARNRAFFLEIDKKSGLRQFLTQNIKRGQRGCWPVPEYGIDPLAGKWSPCNEGAVKTRDIPADSWRVFYLWGEETLSIAWQQLGFCLGCYVRAIMCTFYFYLCSLQIQTNGFYFPTLNSRDYCAFK